MNTANKNGILFGLLCPGVLKVKGKPVAILCNGVRLPVFPWYDETEWPFVFVYEQEYEGVMFYSLVLAKSTPVYGVTYDGTEAPYWLLYRGDTLYVWHYLTAPAITNEWVDVGAQEFTNNDYDLYYMTISDLVWANRDIRRESDGSVYFPGSDPIPIYE